MSLKSNKDWSGRMVNGVILGQPSRDFYDEEGVGSGAYIWDGVSPSGEINNDGKLMVEEADEAGTVIVIEHDPGLTEVVKEELADLDVRKKDEGAYIPPDPESNGDLQ